MKPAAGWYPVKLEPHAGGEAALTWRDLSGVDLNTPFFEDAIRRARPEWPEQRQSSLRDLGEISLPPAIAPTAFIFHTSRSGSTLLTQLLSCLDGSVAISEPPIIDEILMLRKGDEEEVVLIRQMVRVLGQQRSASDRWFFIKHDSWHLRWLPLIHQAFPATPCFLCFRDPVEILWSHHRQRGSQMVPGLRDPALFDIDPDNIDPADLDAFAACALESMFTRALSYVQNGLLIPLEHRRLAETIRTEVFARLGIQPTGSEAARLHERGLYHSKRVGDPYQADAEKRIPAALLVRLQSLCASRLTPLYHSLLGSII